jgi:protein MAK11
MAKPGSSKKPAKKVVKKARIEEPVQRVSKKARIATPPPPKTKSSAKTTSAGPSSSSKPSTKTSSNPQNGSASKSKGKGKTKSTDQDEDTSSALPTTFKVVAGSYEKLLYGLNGSTTVNDKGEVEYHLKPLFIFPAHVSCIKAVSASPQGGKWLATGSADEIVKIWDLRRKKEVGGLMHHEGTLQSSLSLHKTPQEQTQTSYSRFFQVQ